MQENEANHNPYSLIQCLYSSRRASQLWCYMFGQSSVFDKDRLNKIKKGFIPQDDTYVR